jgi:hypothetical protein
MQHRRSIHRKNLRPGHPLSLAVPMPRPGSLPDVDTHSAMRALTLIYHEDLEPAITAIIQQKMLVARYTKIRDVIGARADVLQDVDYDPQGLNHLLIVVAALEVVQELSDALRDLRQRQGHGLRGYITPVDGLI